MRHSCGVGLIAGPRADSLEALCKQSVGPLLDVLGAHGGLVVFDLGSFPELAHVTALEAADLVVVPVTPLISSLGTMPRARQFLGELGITADRIMPVINHVYPDAEQVDPQLMVRLLGTRTCREIPFGGRDVARSLDEGLPICLLEPRSAIAQAVDQVGRDVLKRLGLGDELPEPVAAGGLAWMRRIFGQKGATYVRP